MVAERMTIISTAADSLINCCLDGQTTLLSSSLVCSKNFTRLNPDEASWVSASFVSVLVFLATSFLLSCQFSYELYFERLAIRSDYSAIATIAEYWFLTGMLSLWPCLVYLTWQHPRQQFYPTGSQLVGVQPAIGKPSGRCQTFYFSIISFDVDGKRVQDKCG